MPSAHHVTHHLCVSDSHSGLFSVLSQSSRPIVHLFLDTIFHQHDVFKSFLIFASKSLLLLILSLHPGICQHYLHMQRASIFRLPFDSHHYTLSSGSFILCVKPEWLVPFLHLFQRVWWWVWDFFLLVGLAVGRKSQTQPERAKTNWKLPTLLHFSHLKRKWERIIIHQHLCMCINSSFVLLISYPLDPQQVPQLFMVP